MHKYFLSLLFITGLLVVGCSTSMRSVQDTQAFKEDPKPVFEERISLNINEAVYFDFIKVNENWSGELVTYTLNSENEKVVNRTFVSAQDSSWNDFEAFVDFLKIMDLPPQNEIEGWVPDSSQLPRRVYSFEVFDGDTTRSFSYQDPVDELRDYWQSQNVLTFVTFVQNDLRWIEKKNIE